MKKFISISQFSLVLFGFMICGLFLTGLLGMIPIGEAGSMSRQWLVFSGQNILAFILPAVMSWIVCFKARPWQAIEADVRPSWRMLAVALAVYALSIPALNQIVYWNQEMHLPEAFSAFEQWCRDMESLAEEQTKGLLESADVSVTLMNIFVIGILTGVGEEFFFRGALQRMLVASRVNVHVAVWSAAIVFSALHFQFFGFVPRVLLGVWFGYLYYWSGSIWVNSFAHALNNSLVIVSAWCINKGILSEDFDMWGVSSGSFPVLPLVSAFAVTLLIIVLYRCGVLSSSRAMTPPSIPNSNSNASEK